MSTKPESDSLVSTASQNRVQPRYQALTVQADYLNTLTDVCHIFGGVGEDHVTFFAEVIFTNDTQL